MDFKDLAPMLTKLAPTIATALGGPLAGGAVSALESVFGLNTEGTTEDKQNALAVAISGATPDQLLKMKQADNDYLLQMQKLGFEDKEAMAKMMLDDTDSARKREEVVKDSTPTVLAYILTTGFFAVLSFMLFYNVPAASRDLLNILLGMLGTSFAGVISYYFGSSAGSAAKTELLAKADAIK